MVAKELIDARWKAIIGMVLAAVTVLVGVFTFDLMRNALSPTQLQQLSDAGRQFGLQLDNYDASVWTQTFSITGNGGLILMIVAVLLGSSLIANEVGKGTIFLLLSRPLSRDRILLSKYLVGAAVLLGMCIMSGLVLDLGAFIAGHSLNLAGISVSVLLFWLGTLFVLGVATLFSIVFSDVLRPLALTVVVLLLLSLPAFFPNGGDWVLPSYWRSFAAFTGQEFPLKALIISLVAAAVPLMAAVPLFRRQEY